MSFDTMSEELLDNAIKSMERAVECSSIEDGDYYLREAAGWLKVAKFARKGERDAEV